MVQQHLQIDGSLLEVVRGEVLRDCIPQYGVGHAECTEQVLEYIQQRYQGRLSLVGASYLGVSVNDCVYRARYVASQIGKLVSAHSNDIELDDLALFLLTTGLIHEGTTDQKQEPRYVSSVWCSCPAWTAQSNLITVLTEEVDDDAVDNMHLRQVPPVVLESTISSSSTASNTPRPLIDASIPPPQITVAFKSPCRILWVQLMQSTSRIQEIYFDNSYMSTVRAESLVDDDYADNLDDQKPAPDRMPSDSVVTTIDPTNSTDMWFLSTIDEFALKSPTTCTIKFLGMDGATKISIASIVFGISVSLLPGQTAAPLTAVAPNASIMEGEQDHLHVSNNILPLGVEPTRLPYDDNLQLQMYMQMYAKMNRSMDSGKNDGQDAGGHTIANVHINRDPITQQQQQTDPSSLERRLDELSERLDSRLARIEQSLSLLLKNMAGDGKSSVDGVNL
ncbi:hypothetical protein BASA60_000829 [Batrachochytrium salamandrivorans]|nr:hypothetical protein BASA60_000829 [Batrachochytrium salamandrivorans]